MKKLSFLLLFVYCFASAQAQEVIPLFDDIPVFESDKKKTAVQDSSFNPAVKMPERKASSSFVEKPNLGRGAKPVSELKIPAFGMSIGLDSHPVQKVSKVQDEVSEVEAVSEAEVLKRENPLTMTEKKETLDDYLLRVMQEKTGGERGTYNPLGRHNASGFLISSVGLGMSISEVEDALGDKGYHLERVDRTIDPGLMVAYEKRCRGSRGLYIVSDIRACIEDLAQEDENKYVKGMLFSRPVTRETIYVEFTSPATENISYRISYYGKGDNSLNSSRQAMDIKLRRKKDFWALVFSTYGLPDDDKNFIWGDINESFLKAGMFGSAYDAYLTLESSRLQDDDYVAQKEFLSEYGSGQVSGFTFVSPEDVMEQE